MKKFSNMTHVTENILILEYIIYVNLPFYKCIFLYLGNHLCSKKRYMRGKRSFICYGNKVSMESIFSVLDELIPRFWSADFENPKIFS